MKIVGLRPLHCIDDLFCILIAEVNLVMIRQFKKHGRGDQ